MAFTKNVTELQLDICKQRLYYTTGYGPFLSSFFKHQNVILETVHWRTGVIMNLLIVMSCFVSSSSSHTCSSLAILYCITVCPFVGFAHLFIWSYRCVLVFLCFHSLFFCYIVTVRYRRILFLQAQASSSHDFGVIQVKLVKSKIF